MQGHRQGNIAMMSEDQLAEALAEIAVKIYGRKPPQNVLRAFGVIVATAIRTKAVKAPTTRTKQLVSRRRAQ